MLTWFHFGFLRVCLDLSIDENELILSCFLVDVDILKPDTGYLSVIERPSAFGLASRESTTPSSHQTQSPPSTSESAGSPMDPVYTEPLSEGEDDDEELAPARDEGKRTGLSGTDLELAISYREQMLKERKEEADKENRRLKKAGKEKDIKNGIHEQENGAGAPAEALNSEAGEHTESPRRQKSLRAFSTISKKAFSIDPLALSTAFDETLKTKLEGEELRRCFKKGSSGPQVHTPQSGRSRCRA